MSEEASFRADGALLNAITGLGTERDKSNLTTVVTPYLLQKEELEALYMGEWMARRVIDLVPDNIRKGEWTVKSGDQIDASIASDVKAYHQDLKVYDKFADASKLQRLYGGSVILLFIDDGLDPSEPVDPQRIRSIRGMVALDRHQVSPKTAMGWMDLTNPEFYLIGSTAQTSAEFQPAVQTVHRSRVLRFDGLFMPWRMKQSNHGWGLSVLQPFWESYRQYEAGLRGVGSALNDFDTFIHRIPGLGEMIRAGREDDIRKRMEVNMLSKSAYRGMVLDINEDASYITRTLAGVADVMDRLLTDIQGAVGVPKTLLLGESPGGLGRDGRYEERVWAERCGEWRSMNYANPAKYLMGLIFASKDGPTGGQIPTDWDIDWPSLYEMTDEEKVALLAQMSGIDNTYISLNVLSADEVREARFGGDDYSWKTTLNPSLNPNDPNFQLQKQVRDLVIQQAMQPPQPEMPPEQQPGQPAAPAQDAKAKTDSLMQQLRADGVKKLVRMNGVTLGITHEPGDLRFGSVMKDGYGHIRRTWGQGMDGQSIDAYLGPKRDSGKVYKVRQLKDDGTVDEGKYMFGYDSVEHARDSYVTHAGRARFGGIREVDPEELMAYQGDDAYAQ